MATKTQLKTESGTQIEPKMTADNLVESLGNTPVNRATADSDGKAINETYATKTNLDEKQDKLTAGTNITIDENNVISATDGGGKIYYKHNIRIRNSDAFDYVYIDFSIINSSDIELTILDIPVGTTLPCTVSVKGTIMSVTYPGFYTRNFDIMGGLGKVIKIDPSTLSLTALDLTNNTYMFTDTPVEL